jgi:hypothetical protein
MTSLRIHPQVAGNQNLILERLHAEAIAVQSIQAYYIPRTLIAENTILGEDRLSEFKHAYPIDVFLESTDGYEGQNSFASKFGLQIDSSATLVVARRSWDAAVGQYGNTILPNRPAEGDLIHIPMVKGLFEINFANHQAPFYQLGQSYVYKMTIQLFRYSSENIDTGIPEIDGFETTHTADTTIRPNIDTAIRGADNNKFKTRAADLIFDANNPFGDIL